MSTEGGGTRNGGDQGSHERFQKVGWPTVLMGANSRKGHGVGGAGHRDERGEKG